jgi:hypothetical protein
MTDLPGVLFALGPLECKVKAADTAYLVGSVIAVAKSMARVWPLPPHEPEDVPDPPRPRRTGLRRTLSTALRRGSRWALWTAAAIVGLLVLVWILSYVMDGPLTRYMQRSVNQRLKGYTASVRRAHFNPFNLSVTLHEVGLVQDAHPDPAIARFPLVWADLEWSSLLHGRVVAKFDFTDPVLYIDRNHFEQEAKDPTPIKEHGWQEALEAIYPLKMNLFRVGNGTVTYVDRGGTRPLELKGLNIEAHNVRNVRSPDREYPSKVHVESTVFDRGRAVLDGSADFMAEPHVTFKGDASFDQIVLDYFAPVLERYHVIVRKGTLAAQGTVEYGRNFQTVHLKMLAVTGLDADYDYRAAAPKPEKAVAETTKEKAAEVSNAPDTMLRADAVQVTGSVGLINHSATPPYRVFLSNLDLSVKNFSNQFSQGPATARMTGKFMGSGRTQVAATFRPEDKGPDFDLEVKIDDTDMTTMNDLLRAYGKFDVVQGLFSFYSELKVKNQQVVGYIKPLFRDVKAYDKRQDAEKSMFRKLYEKLIGGVSRILENRPRQEVATKTTIQGELGGPGGTKMKTGEALANLVRNAFFRAILPGFDAELRGGGRGDRGRQVGKDQPAHVDRPVGDVAPPAKARSKN